MVGSVSSGITNFIEEETTQAISQKKSQILVLQATSTVTCSDSDITGVQAVKKGTSYGNVHPENFDR